MTDLFDNFGPFRPIQAQILPDDGIEMFYQPGETLFGPVAMPMRELGWAVFPQDRDGQRKPAAIDGRAILISQYFDEPASLEVTQRWAQQAASSNAAILLGPASGHVFCIDADILNMERSQRVRMLAREHFGDEAVLWRFGTFPKVAMIYRYDPAEGTPRGRTLTFADSDDAIEILGRGKAITAHGHHHKTGAYFKWRGLPPTLQGPEAAPMVTHAQLEAFLAAVAAEFPFRQSVSAKMVTLEGVERNGIHMPVLKSGDWTVDKITGLVVDGRENFLWQLCKRAVQRNAGYTQDEDGLNQIGAGVFDEFRERAEKSGQFADDFRLKRDIYEKIHRAARMLAAGELQPIADGDLRKNYSTLGKKAPKSGLFGSLLRKHRAELKCSFTAPDDAIAAARALQTDRRASSRAVADGIAREISAALDDVYTRSSNAHLIKTPTGAGKTTHTLRALAQDPRTFMDFEDEEGAGIGPFAFLLPTYNNIDEVRARAEMLNLDPDLSDEDLAEAAAGAGLYKSGEEAAKELDRLRAEAMNAGLKSMVFMGKIAAGCKISDRVARLMEANIGTAGMCKARVFDKMTGETEEKHCVHYFSCPAIAQRAEIKNNHIVFLPRNFLDLSIPEELKRIRAVICDESVYGLLVHTTSFPISVFDILRADPKPTKAEEEAGIEPRDLLAFREHAAGVVIDAFSKGECPAAALKDFKIEFPRQTLSGLELATYAKRVCGAEVVSQSRINPDLSDAELEEICSLAQGEYIRAEHRFWSIVCNRIEQLEGEVAQGDREMRIQLLKGDTESPEVRISWLSEANWAEIPMILLDASGNADLLGRVLDGRKVVEHRVDVDLNLSMLVVNDRRFAMHNIVPSVDASMTAKLAAARTIHEIRCVISMICGIYAHGRILFGMPMKLRRAVCASWCPPINADFGHFNAMAGLDFARNHVGVVSIGRMELPTQEIDGQVAALTYRDKAPEQPIDKFGVGLDSEGKTIYPHVVERSLQMRDGSTATYEAQEHEGELARQVQAQHREENVKQLVGRVRPIHRENTPFAIVIGQAVPDDFIVDEIACWEDFSQVEAKYWNAARRTGVINATAMYRACPDVGTHEDFERWIDRLPDEVLERYHSLEVQFEGSDDIDMLYVPGEFAPEQLADHVRWFLRRLGLSGTSDNLELCEIREPAADERPKDPIEEHLDNRYKQLKAEETLIKKQRETVQCRGEWKEGGRNYRCGDGEIKMVSASFGVWNALEILDDQWVQRGVRAVEDEQKEPKAPVAIEPQPLDSAGSEITEFLDAMGM